MKYMHIIDKTIQQIVVQQESMDPDPSASLAHIDVKMILSKMAVDGDRLRETEERLKRATERYRRLERELDNVKTTDSTRVILRNHYIHNFELNQDRLLRPLHRTLRRTPLLLPYVSLKSSLACAKFNSLRHHCRPPEGSQMCLFRHRRRLLP